MTMGANAVAQDNAGARIRRPLSDQVPVWGDDQNGVASAPISNTSVTRGTLRLHQTWNAPGAGAQDVVLFAAGAIPSGKKATKWRIVDAFVQISNIGAGGGSAQLRDTAAGGGSVLSSAMSTAAAATARNSDSQSRTVLGGSAGLAIILRLTDGTTVGEVWVEVAPEA